MSGNYPGDGSPSIASAFYNKGTALGQNLSVGTADNYQLTIITNGTDAVTIDTSQNVTVAGTLTVSGATVFTGVLEAPNGTAAAPSFTFASDLDCGMYRISANTVGFSTNGTLALTLSSAQAATFAGAVTASTTLAVTGVSTFSAGAVGAPSITFGDATTGFYRASANRVDLAVSGVQICEASAALLQMTSTTQLETAQGTVSAPALVIGTSLGTGIYQATTNTVNIATNGALQLTIGATGSLVMGNAAIATNATDGFLYVASCAGAATGTPTTNTGRTPIVFDSTNGRLYAYYGGAWKYAAVAS